MFVDNANNIGVRKWSATIEVNMDIRMWMARGRLPEVVKTRMTRGEFLNTRESRRFKIGRRRNRHGREGLHADGIQEFGEVSTGKLLWVALIEEMVQGSVKEKNLMNGTKVCVTCRSRGVGFICVLPMDPGVSQFFGKTKEIKISAMFAARISAVNRLF